MVDRSGQRNRFGGSSIRKAFVVVKIRNKLDLKTGASLKEHFLQNSKISLSLFPRFSAKCHHMYNLVG